MYFWQLLPRCKKAGYAPESFVLHLPSQVSQVFAIATPPAKIDHSLRPIKRFITAHDTQGRSTLTSTVPENADPWQHLPKASMFLAYTTEDSPVRLEDDTDRYGNLLYNPPGLAFGSSVCRVVDISPGDVSPMHRTQTIDYGIVIEGKVELILDNCTRVMERGDICVQRATMHAWRNLSANEWARIAFVLIPCDKPVVDGKELGQNMDLVEGSLKEIFARSRS
ncbi:Cupin domain-containing protein [Cladophialophora immunda]|nr:Cupin domain-containing protein [Cladophialophora immunda]